eukprot:6816056-Alexandrium_andersonii.AAC.1
MEEINWDDTPWETTEARQKRDAAEEAPVRRRLRCKTHHDSFGGLASETNDYEPDWSNDDAALEIVLQPPEGKRAVQLASRDLT